MKNKKYVIYLYLFLTLPSAFFHLPSAFGQQDNPASECPEPDDKEVGELYRKSQDKKKYQYAERIEFLEKAYAISHDYAPVCYELAMHWQRRADEKDKPCEKCEEYFSSVIRTCPKFHSNPYFYLGYLYYNQGKYDSAIKYCKLFLDFKEDNVKKYDKNRYDRLLTDARDMIRFSKFNKEMYDSPVPYEPKLVEGISTLKDEYLPFISPDNEIAFFTRRIKVQPMGMVWDVSKEKEVFCFSERDQNGKFPEGQPMPTPPFNTHYNEGGASVTIDNKHLYYTVVEEDGNYDIYYSDFINEGWSLPKSLGNLINSADSWDSQPSVSADGKTLYFASNRPGGYGGVDIWKAEKNNSGAWTAPVNLGPKINTPGDEKSPFLHWDSKTLYFSSGDNEQGATTHMNLGGFDIFYSKMDSAGKWMSPKNIGYPINDAGNEVGFFVSSDGKDGYFASNDSKRTKGKSIGGYDIYYFELPLSARPDEVAIIKGKVTNDNGKSVVAEVELKDAVTKKVTKAVVDSITGEYAVAANVQAKHDQLLVVKKEGNAFSSQLISLKNPSPHVSNTASSNTAAESPVSKSPVIKLDMKTDSVKTGKPYTLNNIYFGQNQAELKEESKIVLDEFAEYLKENKNIIIEIYGHTDNSGKPNDNQNLSGERAFTVFEYLRTAGVGKAQITGHKGFGESKPVASNDSEEGKAKNRRTEFVIVGE
jgi:outer membrane protein OmpA-like peptidoglycan-associated protein/tetratricopeptide (TPR) repeat protein